jgi:ADP-heptose:LPS heptosyltransferase
MRLNPPPGRDARRVLVHLATGIGNIMLATPLLVALSRRFARIELRLDCDYPGAGELFRPWSALQAVFDTRAGESPGAGHDIIVPAIPPFAWPRFVNLYRSSAALPRPPDALFYANEQAYYLDFARQLGCDITPAPHGFVPAPPVPAGDIGPGTLVLAPGCKTGIMAAKRWPFFPELAGYFDDVVIAGTADDLRLFDGKPMIFPPHVRSLVESLSLAELAGALACAGAVVANDSGLGHLAAAAGASTVLLFGPTPDDVLGRLAPNITVLRANLACAPCWYASRLAACGGRPACLASLSPATVVDAISACGLPPRRAAPRLAAGGR